VKSPFDLVSLILFAGLAVLFLQRSAAREPDPVPLWRYAVAAVGCAAGDILGNQGAPVAGGLILAATAVGAVIWLKALPVLTGDRRGRP
jgi:hypothetical protein